VVCVVARQALKSVFWVALLMFLFLYVFAIAGIGLFGGLPSDHPANLSMLDITVRHHPPRGHMAS
jgi:Na+/proline symporter